MFSSSGLREVIWFPGGVMGSDPGLDGGGLVWLPEDKTNLVSKRANRMCSTLEVMKLI